MDLYGTITVSHQIALSKEGVEQRKRFLASCKPGMVVKETLVRHHPEKSHQQVKAIWGLLIEAVKKELDEMGFDLGTLLPTAQVPQGVPCPREVLIQVFYACCNDVGPDGERKTLSKMDTIEAATFFDNCRDHAARTWGIIVPDPDPAWREKATQKAPDVATEEAKAGVTEEAPADEQVIPDEPPADFGDDDAGKKFVCSKCGTLYMVKPARGACVAEDDDGFKCGGNVVSRSKQTA